MDASGSSLQVIILAVHGQCLWPGSLAWPNAAYALANESKPGPKARTELQEMGTGVEAAISMWGPFVTSPRLGLSQ